MLHRHEPGQPGSQNLGNPLRSWWACWLLTFENLKHACDAHNIIDLHLNKTYETHMVRQMQASNFLVPQSTNLRKPNRKPSETLNKQPKSTMPTFPNLPKPSHKPPMFSTSPKGNAQNWGAACALFKILKKKAQAVTFLEF